ncbi:hypothetical protein EON82_22080 [bacterium]|nr:MAG: hypothetical protein EON82_22080 [bacterium]
MNDRGSLWRGPLGHRCRASIGAPKVRVSPHSWENLTMRRTLQALSILTSLALAAPCLAATPCQRPASLPRKEFRQLTPAEWTAFSNAVLALKREMRSETISTYDVLAKVLMDNGRSAQGNASFLPWHRRYLKELESNLRRVSGNAAITIPYWDTERDSQVPSASPLFTNAFMGGNGPVSTGVFAGWRPAYPSAHPLLRQFDNGSGISAWQSVEVVRSIVSTTTSYDVFRTRVESGNHARVHTGIGGDMAGTQAANDPIFWLAEANTDRIWDQWQKANRGVNASKYGGRNATAATAALTDRLNPWANTVADVMAAENLGYCYQ